MNDFDDWCKQVGIIPETEAREAWDYQEKQYAKLIEEVIKLNLIVPVSISNDINSQSNKVETELKKLGFNPRKRVPKVTLFNDNDSDEVINLTKMGR